MKDGKTPLVRARALEKRYGIKEIWLKLEGTNPTGHKSDRIASVLVSDMIAHGHKVMVADGTYPFLRSLVHACETHGMTIRIPRFSHERSKTARFPEGILVDMRSVKKDRKDALKAYARSLDAYLVKEGSSHVGLSRMALEPMTEEILDKIHDVTDIHVRISYGYTLSSVYNASLKWWIGHEIESLPRIICGATPETIRWLDSRMEPTGLLDEEDLLMENVRQALHESRGIVTAVSDEDLKEAKKRLRTDENIITGDEGAYAFAAFLNRIRTEETVRGRHVIVLNDGRNKVSIERISSYDDMARPEIHALVERYLGRFGDTKPEVEDAIDNAISKGHVLVSMGADGPDGIAVIVHTGFNRFIPTYHLAYVGISPDTKGRGIGTELIRRAIDLTDGNISLHVDLDNPGAKKLYEKLGFRHVYSRMIHKQ